VRSKKITQTDYCFFWNSCSHIHCEGYYGYFGLFSAQYACFHPLILSDFKGAKYRLSNEENRDLLEQALKDIEFQLNNVDISLEQREISQELRDKIKQAIRSIDTSRSQVSHSSYNNTGADTVSEKKGCLAGITRWLGVQKVRVFSVQELRFA